MRWGGGGGHHVVNRGTELKTNLPLPPLSLSLPVLVNHHVVVQLQLEQLQCVLLLVAKLWYPDQKGAIPVDVTAIPVTVTVTVTAIPVTVIPVTRLFTGGSG